MKTVLFGAGVVGQRLLQEAPGNWNVVAFCDNDPDKQGRVIHEVPVLAPERVAGVSPSRIVIACQYDQALADQLKALGLDHLVAASELPPKPAPSDTDARRMRGEAELEILRLSSQDNGSLMYDLRQARRLAALLEPYQTAPPQKLLHVGPGRSLGVEVFGSLLWGIEFLSVEPAPGFSIPYPMDRHAELAQETLELVRSLAAQAGTPESLSPEPVAEEIDYHHWRVGSGRIRLVHGIPFESESLAVPSNAFDACFSNAVLEHVEDPDSFARRCFDALRPGGLAVHQIDFRDHTGFAFPLDFLRYEETDWNIRMRSVTGCYLNRCRISDYRKAFGQAGFATLREHVNIHNDCDAVARSRAQLAPRFADCSDEDLQAASACFTLQKPTAV